MKEEVTYEISHPDGKEFTNKYDLEGKPIYVGDPIFVCGNFLGVVTKNSEQSYGYWYNQCFFKLGNRERKL